MAALLLRVQPQVAHANAYWAGENNRQVKSVAVKADEIVVRSRGIILYSIIVTPMFIDLVLIGTCDCRMQV